MAKKGYVFLSPVTLYFSFVYSEPESSQKTFLRSKLEMLKLSKLLKHSESKLRLTERLPEPLLMLMLRSTTTSTKLLIPLLSRPRETLKLLDLSSSKESQRLLSSSELEGKF